MLYEMVTGVMPFSGPTTSHTLVRIIEQEPPPLTKTALGQVPAELQRIVRKAMTKSAEDRYQTAKDMLIDLRSLRRQLDGPVAATDDTDDTDGGAGKKRVLVIALVAMVVVTVAIFAVNIWRARRPRSAVPVTSATSPATAVPERTLTYWITVQPFRNGKYQKAYTLAGEVNFEQKDQIRLNIRSPQDGHLYVINEAPRENAATSDYVVLFPSPATNNGYSFLPAERELQFPDPTWLRFDEQQGVERLWLVFAEDPLPQLEQLKGLVNPETRGQVTEATQNKVIRDFLAKNSTAKPDVEKSDTLTTLKGTTNILVYSIRLEHH